MSEYFVGTTGSNSQTTFEAFTTSEVLDDLGLNTTDAPTFSGVFLEGSGNTIFSVDGANGRLFGVTDEVTGTVFSVNDAAGLPILEVESTADYDKITIGEYGSDLLVLSGQTTAEVTGSQIATQSWISDQGFSADTNYYLTGIEKSSNTLTYKVQGASDVSYQFGSNAFTSTTIPSAANDATISISAGSGLSNGGSFTTDQSSNGTITIDHNEFSRSDTTSSESLSFGGTFEAIDSITSSNGHVTAENTMTYTLPTITSGDITGAFGADVVLYDSDGAIEATEFIGDVRGAISFKAQAAEAITKGEAVYISGVSGNTTVVALADANDATKMPAFGIAGETAGANNPVTVINFGELANLDTDTPNWDEGDELFVSTTAGALTTTAPTSESSLLQKIAKVTKRHASTGSITVMGAGRTNAVPNLNEGRLFVGNSSNQAVADGTVHVDIANSRVGIGTTSPVAKLHVYNSSGGNATNKAGMLSEAVMKLQPHASNSTNMLFAQVNSGDGMGIQVTNGTATANWDIALSPFGGNVGIGTTSPAQKLHVGSGHLQLDDTYKIQWGGTNARIDGSNASDYLRFWTSDTERLRIDSSGKVGIGTTSPATKLHVGDGSADDVLRVNYNSSTEYLDIHGYGIVFDRGYSYLNPAADNSRTLSIGTASARWGTLDIYGSTTNLYGNFSVSGNLTVNGTTTTINSTTISVDDKNIELGSVGTPTDTTADGGGITLKGATDKTINWVNSTSSWTSNQTFSAPNLTLTSLSNQSSEATALVIDGNNAVGYRELGSAAFSATSDFAAASHTHAASEITSGTLDAARLPKPTSGDWWNGGAVVVGTDGVMEVGKYLDFHTSDTGTSDYDVRITATNNAISVGGSLTATSLIKSGGTSSQFLKADGSVDSNTYLTAHPTISAASSSDNSGRTYIQDILLDSNGHVTGITTATETVTDTNTTYSAGTHLSLSGTTFNVDFATANKVVNIGHNSTNNEGEIILDTSTGGSPQISFTDHGDASWAIGVDDDDNSFKIHGSASSTIPTINGLVTPLFEITTGGIGYLGTNRLFADNYHPNADKLTAARTISLGGDLSGSASFDGSANITITAAVANDSHTHNANNLTGTTLASGVTASSLTSVGTITSGTWQGSVIASAYLDADTAHLSGTQTFTGAKTFNNITAANGYKAEINESSDGDNITSNNVKYGYLSNAAVNKPVSGNSHYASVGKITLTHYDTSTNDDFYIRASSYNGLTSWAKIFTSRNSSGITTVGTITSGEWNGSVIASAYLDADTAHLSGTQTFSGAKTFSSTATFTSALDVSTSIRGTGDTDTYINFGTADQINMYAGGVKMLSLIESTTDEVVVNDNASLVNFRVEGSAEANALFVQGSNGFVGIHTNAPDYELHVIGTASFTDTVAGAYFEENASHPSLKKMDTGTILVMNEDGDLVPCSKADDTMVFGVSKHSYKQPIVMGAEPIKVTGPIKVGDFITTSEKAGHGKKSNQPYPFGTIIAQAMESGDGESHTIKAMIRKM